MYQKFTSGAVLRISDGAQIPPDPSNRDYKDFLAWEGQGNTVPAVPSQGPTAQDKAERQARKDAAEAKLKETLGIQDIKGVIELFQDGGK